MHAQPPGAVHYLASVLHCTVVLGVQSLIDITGSITTQQHVVEECCYVTLSQ